MVFLRQRGYNKGSTEKADSRQEPRLLMMFVLRFIYVKCDASYE
jgi:hypothetical protein